MKFLKSFLIALLTFSFILTASWLVNTYWLQTTMTQENRNSALAMAIALGVIAFVWSHDD